MGLSPAFPFLAREKEGGAGAGLSLLAAFPRQAPTSSDMPLYPSASREARSEMREARGEKREERGEKERKHGLTVWSLFSALCSLLSSLLSFLNRLRDRAACLSPLPDERGPASSESPARAWHFFSQEPPRGYRGQAP